MRGMFQGRLRPNVFALLSKVGYILRLDMKERENEDEG